MIFGSLIWIRSTASDLSQSCTSAGIDFTLCAVFDSKVLINKEKKFCRNSHVKEIDYNIGNFIICSFSHCNDARLKYVGNVPRACMPRFSCRTELQMVILFN